MFSFFAPRYVREGKMILKNAHKLLHYKRDLLSEASIADFTALTDLLEKALRERDEPAVRDTVQKLEAQWSAYLPPAHESGWRENCEVFLVAIIIALGVRTYFIQPFTIPTGSMQPTLYGIIGTETNQPAPNLLTRALHLCAYGRSYVDVVAKEDEAIVKVEETKRFFFLTFTEIQCTHNRYSAWAPRETVIRDLHLDPTRLYNKGEPIVRGYVNTGDHVFVDKFTYHFFPPKRGDVFVFSTADIRGLATRHDNSEGSQYYIKRLAGLPGDVLRIDPPNLYVNGSLAKGTGFERVMSQKNGYHGYVHPDLRNWPVGGLLVSSDEELQIKPHCYFAMGDNSRNSLDGRYWGFVPEHNIMGRAVFVYWPFANHWGLIR
jgi:signal peptidase I